MSFAQGNSAATFVRARSERGEWRGIVRFFFFGVALAAAVTRSGFATAEVYLNANQGPVPPVYFGMHIHDAAADAWPAVPFGTWRLWDAGVAWPNLEAREGEWHFERLDDYVKYAKAHGVEILLPLGLTPRWASARPDEPSAYDEPGWAAEPRRLADWRAYVRRVAQRYRGAVRYYEIWNEPNVKRFYSGSIERLIELTRATREELKAVDPAAVLVSPSYVDPTGLKQLDEFLAKGGGKYVDVIGFHFYATSEKPEDMLAMIHRVRAVMEKRGAAGKPLWNTETGWLIGNSRGPIDPVKVGFPRDTPVLTPEEAAGYVARALILTWAAGVNRLYWYAWDNKAMGLSEEAGKTLKPAAHAYRRIYQWLDGATVNFCRGAAKGIWECQLTRGGDRAWVVWTSAGQSRWTPPSDWRAAQWQSLDARKIKLGPSGTEITIGPRPILITRSTHLRQAAAP